MTLRDPTHLFEGEVSPRAERLARIVSVATHAPFLSAVLFALLNVTDGGPADWLVWTAVTLLTATVLPLAIVQHYSVRYGNTDGDVARREDRALPLLGGILSYILGAALLVLLDAPEVSAVSMASYACSTVLVLLISTRWKISIHATGAAGPATALTMVYWPWGLAFFALVPLVAWSRYVRRKHTPLQLAGGAVFGTVFTGLFLWAFLG